jgi:hypothetical protein
VPEQLLVPGHRRAQGIDLQALDLLAAFHAVEGAGQGEARAQLLVRLQGHQPVQLLGGQERRPEVSSTMASPFSTVAPGCFRIRSTLASSGLEIACSASGTTVPDP